MSYHPRGKNTILTERRILLTTCILVTQKGKHTNHMPWIEKDDVWWHENWLETLVEIINMSKSQVVCFVYIPEELHITIESNIEVTIRGAQLWSFCYNRYKAHKTYHDRGAKSTCTCTITNHMTCPVHLYCTVLRTGYCEPNKLTKLNFCEFAYVSIITMSSCTY